MRISFFPIEGWFARRVRAAVGAGAAVFHEIVDQRIHRGIVGAIDQRAVLALLHDQPGVPKLGQVEGQGAVGDAELLGDRTGRQALVAGLHEQPEQGETVLLRQRTKRFDRTVGTHPSGSSPSALQRRSRAPGPGRSTQIGMRVGN
jgi:hypothetical protein